MVEVYIGELKRTTLPTMSGFAVFRGYLHDHYARGVLYSVLYGESSPQDPTPIGIPFGQERYSFRNPLNEKKIPLSYTFIVARILWINCQITEFSFSCSA